MMGLIDALTATLHSATPHGDVIDRLGGTSAVAAELRIGASAVSQWRLGGIPARRWPALEAMARRLGVPGVTLASLAQHSPLAVPSPAPASLARDP